MNYFRFHLTICAGAALLWCIAGCSSSKLLPQGMHRLDKNEIIVNDSNKEIKPPQLEFCLRQQPNKNTLFGIHLNLGIYLAAPSCDSCWLAKAMHMLGEAPVIFDPIMVDISTKNIEHYLKSHGYFHAKVRDSTILNRHKAKVIYMVDPGRATRIQSFHYDLGDDSLAHVIMADSSNSLLRAGGILSMEMMNRERERLETLLHNKAFYSFGKNQITFLADTLENNGKAKLTMTWAALPNRDTMIYRTYTIRNVKIYSNFDQLSAYSDSTYYETLQQVNLLPDSGKGSLTLYYRDQSILRPRIFLDAMYIKPGDKYNRAQINATYNNLINLNVFKMVNIQFMEVADDKDNALVDCVINLTSSKPQGFKTGFEISFGANALFGISPSISYFHKNLFKGAEYLNLSFSGNFQLKFGNINQQATEISASPSLYVPKFLFPWLYRSMRPYLPRSEFLSSYSYQFRPDYTRNTLSFSFGYSWQGTSRLTYYVTPINLSIIKVYNLSRSFYESLTDPFLRNRYENHFVLGPTAAIVYTNRQPDKQLNSIYLRWNIKTAGNTLGLLNSFLPYKTVASRRQILGTTYAQFVKTDLNISYYQYFNESTMLAYRFFGGLGRGYGNSIAVPFEEMYFSGGAYSLRGWQARTLGPGSSPIDTTFLIPNQIGDMRLEANIELRYNIFGALDGALFFEGGNIWSLNPDDNRSDAFFRWSEFYKQLAFNSGIGLRLNFGFLIIRFDLGIKIHDPVLRKGWVKPRNLLTRDNLSFHFGIGYPF